MRERSFYIVCLYFFPALNICIQTFNVLTIKDDVCLNLRPNQISQREMRYVKVT